MLYEMQGMAIAVERGCGTRTEGGMYLTTGMGSGGSPLESFLICPPHPVPVTMGLTPIGVRLFAVQNDAGEFVTHIADWVGSASYLNVTDFIEEVRRFGLSRKIDGSILAQANITAFDKATRKTITIATPPLTSESRIFLCHSRAFIDNPNAFLAAGADLKCPKYYPEHVTGGAEEVFCLGLAYENVEGGNPGQIYPDGVYREMPSFGYYANKAPAGVTAVYSAQPAFFAKFPITMIEIVSGTDVQNAANAANAAKAKLPSRVTTN